MGKRYARLPMVLLVAMAMILAGSFCQVGVANAGTLGDFDKDVQEAIEKTVDFYRAQGAPTDEWVVFGLNAVGEDVNKVPYYSKGNNFLDSFTLPGKSSDNYTIGNFAKAIFALRSLGQDVNNFQDMNLVEKLTDFDKSQVGTANFAAFALMVIDHAGTDTGENAKLTRDELVGFLLNYLDADTWGYEWDGVFYPDLDTPAQVVMALAPYYLDEDNNVNHDLIVTRVDHVLEWFKKQLPLHDSCGMSMVIQALTAIGEDPSTWDSGNNLVRDFLSYQLDDGSFEWMVGMGSDPTFATPQALQALAALESYISNDRSIIYHEINYEEKNVVTLRIEGGQTEGTLLDKKTVYLNGNNNSLYDAVYQAVYDYGLTDYIKFDGECIVPGDGLSVPDNNKFFCVINEEYPTEDNPTNLDNVDIVLYLGDEKTQLARLSIDGHKVGNVYEVGDKLDVRVEKLCEDEGWLPSVNTAVYLSVQDAVTTDEEQGRAVINLDQAGEFFVYAQGFRADGTPLIVKTPVQRITVQKPEAVDPTDPTTPSTDITVYVKVMGKTETYFKGNVTVSKNKAHALEALVQTGLDFDTRSDGLYVYVVEGEKEDLTSTAGWKFLVNDIDPGIPALNTKIKDGDEIIWYWAKDYRDTSPGGGRQTVTPAPELTEDEEAAKEEVGKEGQEILKTITKELAAVFDDASPEKASIEVAGDKVIVVGAEIRMSTEEQEYLEELFADNNVRLEQMAKAKADNLVADEENEVELNIPKGALTEDVKITIHEEKVSPKVPVTHKQLGSVYSFGPAGLKFEEDVQISLPFLPEDKIDPKDIVLAWYDDDSQGWVAIPAVVDLANGRVTGLARHFTKFAVLVQEKKPLVFNDLRAEEYPWAIREVSHLSALGILNGIDENSFAPNQAVTRAQFTKLLVEALDLPTSKVELAFNDVSAGSWYYSYLQSGIAEGIIQGRGDGSFAPDAPISRQEMAVMLERVLESGTATETVEFTDYNQISPWALDAVTLVVDAGLVKGFEDGTFKPMDLTTRAQSAVVIYRLLGK